MDTIKFPLGSDLSSSGVMSGLYRTVLHQWQCQNTKSALTQNQEKNLTVKVQLIKQTAWTVLLCGVLHLQTILPCGCQAALPLRARTGSFPLLLRAPANPVSA